MGALSVVCVVCVAVEASGILHRYSICSLCVLSPKLASWQPEVPFRETTRALNGCHSSFLLRLFALSSTSTSASTSIFFHPLPLPLPLHLHPLRSPSSSPPSSPPRISPHFPSFRLFHSIASPRSLVVPPSTPASSHRDITTLVFPRMLSSLLLSSSPSSS